MAGTNKVAEFPAAGLTAIAQAANRPPSSVTVPAGRSTVVFAIQAIVTSLNSTDVAKDALADLASAVAAPDGLRAAHEAAWSARNDGGGLEVEGDLELAQALNASLYFIRSSIRPDYPHGLYVQRNQNFDIIFQNL